MWWNPYYKNGGMRLLGSPPPQKKWKYQDILATPKTKKNILWRKNAWNWNCLKCKNYVFSPFGVLSSCTPSNSIACLPWIEMNEIEMLSYLNMLGLLWCCSNSPYIFYCAALQPRTLTTRNIRLPGLKKIVKLYSLFNSTNQLCYWYTLIAKME